MTEECNIVIGETSIVSTIDVVKEKFTALEESITALTCVVDSNDSRHTNKETMLDVEISNLIRKSDTHAKAIDGITTSLTQIRHHIWYINDDINRIDDRFEEIVFRFGLLSAMVVVWLAAITVYVFMCL